MFTLVLAQALSTATSPLEIYERAISAMHAIVAPPFLSFDADVTSKIRSTVVHQHVTHVERTHDGADVSTDVDATVDDRATPFDIAPDLFLGRTDDAARVRTSTSLASGLDEPADELKTIAVVSARSVHYAISVLGTDDLPDCTAAIHLKLEPLQGPLVHNLRDLWIDPATSRICRAVAVWRGHVGAIPALAPITIDLDNNGYVDHFKTVVSVHFVLGVTSVRQEAFYSNVRPADEAARSSFDAKKKALDVKP